MSGLWALALAVLLTGCGRYFAGPLRPAEQQAASMRVNDDGSVVYTQGRLEITLAAMTDEQLNRQFASASGRGGRSTNPYTFGDWRPLGDTYTPPRFNVFRIKVSNYAYPKVRLDPYQASIATANNRRYKSLRLDELTEYYRAYALGLAGNAWTRFKDRTDILRRTLYPRDPLFSGQEKEGFIVFPPLDDDVKELAVTLSGIVLRFNYADEPIETVDLTYLFSRDVFRGMHPPPELAGGQ
ncbi:MAG: hypothetical protein AB1505_31315 [Candidatus Latescibacterota bacterium]